VGHVSTAVLLRDMHRRPVLFRWVALAARWWNKLAGADSSVPRLARSAWHAEIAPMRGHTTGTVCTDCWAHRLLAALEANGALPRGWLWSIDLYALRFDEGVVRQRLDACLNAVWGAVPAVCPRVAPSAGVAVATHVHWVYAFEASRCYGERRSAPAYMRLCLPLPVVQALARLRLGQVGGAPGSAAAPNRAPRPVAMSSVLCCRGPGSAASGRAHARRGVWGWGVRGRYAAFLA
jgi:hypothetical protein